MQQSFELATHAGDLPVAEMRALIMPVHLQFVAGHYRQAQRVMGLLVRLQIGEAQAIALPLQHLIYRVVLEHQQGIEQLAPGVAGQLLQAEQRHLLVLAQRQIVRLQRVEPVADRLMRLRRLHHRQGIDEQAKHVFDARHTRRPPRYGGTEGDLTAPAITLHKQRPGRLDQGVEGDASSLGKGFEFSTRQVQDMHAAAACRQVAAQTASQQRRFIEALQLLTPERLAAGEIPALQPGQVIRVMPDLLRAALAARVLQYLRQQRGTAPAVEQDMVQGPDQLMTSLAQAYQHQAHQRWPRQVEWRLALLTQQCLKIEVAPLQFANRQLRLALHQLHRLLIGAQTQEGCAQQRMALQSSRPGRLETRHRQALDLQAELVDVGAIGRLQFAVEQQALLHRRQRIDVFDLPGRQRQAVEFGLAERHEGEIAGGDGRLRAAVLHQLDERAAVRLEQFDDALAVEALMAEGAGELQAAARDATVQSQGTGQRCAGVALCAGRFLSQIEQLPAGLQAAQVVEQQRIIQRRQVLALQVFQQAVTDAAARHPAQVLLGALEGRIPVVTGLQQQRVEAGEPAQGLAQVQLLEQRFAAMAFEGDQGLRLPVPVTQGMGQCTEQEVVDLRAVRRRSLYQQRLGGGGIELHL